MEISKIFRIFRSINILFIFSFIIPHNTIYSQNDKISFQSLQLNTANQSVFSVFKDSKGFMWFCTNDGLYMYDGYKFTIYRNSNIDTNSLSDNSVSCIVEDKYGVFWIGTRNGLNRFERNTHTFTRYYSNESSIFSGHIQDLYIDNESILWIGTKEGMVKYDILNNRFTKLLSDVKINSDVIKPTIQSIIENDNNSLWLATSNIGLILFNKRTGAYKCYSHDEKNSNSIAENWISSLYLDKKKKELWIGNYSKMVSKFNIETQKFDHLQNKFKGEEYKRLSINSILQDELGRIWLTSLKFLLIYDPKNETYIKYENNPLDPTSFTLFDVKNMYKDDAGIIWFATDGLQFYDPKKDKFRKYFISLPKEDSKIKQNYVRTIYIDKKENLWIGTFGDGLLKINRKTNSFKRFYWNSFQHFITNINVDKTGNLWLSTGNGLIVFDPTTEMIIKKYNHESTNDNSIYYDWIEKSYLDSHGTLWIFTQESIEQVNLVTGKFIHHNKNNLNGLISYKGKSITEDANGNIWIATDLGLTRYEYGSAKYFQYKYESNKKDCLSNSNVSSVYQAEDGELWITTMNGLNQFERKTNSFKNYFFKDEFISDNMYSTNEDDKNNLWIGTASGIIKFNPQTKSFKQWDCSDGLSSDFTAFYKDNNGRFYINGRYGDLYCFHPDSIVSNTKIPPVHITDFLLFNKSIKESKNKEDIVLLKTLYTDNKIKLTHKQSVFTFEFTALNYTNPEKNLYKYKLEGFDKEWIVTDSKKRFSTYTNLDPGNYVFRVHASNDNGYWNDIGVNIHVKILPPFWRTWWAYIIYFIIIFFLFYLFKRIWLIIERQNSKNYLERKEAERIHEVDQMKLTFFSNISHEFRTPLTLIIGPTEKLIKTVSSNTSPQNIIAQLKLIHRNSLRLERLITEIMDTFKLDSGGMKLNPIEDDLVRYVDDLAYLFKPLVEQKQIQLEIIHNTSSINAWFDPIMMEKVIFNLLSNAFKFTLKGKIEINISTKKSADLNQIIQNDKINEYAVVSIKDSGCGILESDLLKIFSRFYQAGNQEVNRQGGTGLGLALSKELIELHHGIIEVDSTVNSGTCFTIYLPLGNSHFSQEQLTHVKDNKYNIQNQTNLKSLLEPIENNIPDDSNETLLPLLLIVEDNLDLRIYLKQSLSEKFRIELAEHGKEGYKKALEFIPDLIISDVMMPEMDGIEMTRRIKADNRTCHIPIILLTAKDSNENKFEGLKTGAFDYITKPFNEDMLLLKINNISKTQEALRFYYKEKLSSTISDNKYIITPNEYNVPSADDIFIDELKRIIEDNLSDSDFSHEILASKIGMSSRTLNRKINSLLNQSPGDVIMDIRLKRSKQLLSQSDLTISEIAFQCGFSNPNHFATCFKKMFGQKPSESRS